MYRTLTLAEQKTIAGIVEAFKLGDNQRRYLEWCVRGTYGSIWGTHSEDRRLYDSLLRKSLVADGYRSPSQLVKRILAGELTPEQGWDEHLEIVRLAKIAQLREEAAEHERTADAHLTLAADLRARADKLEGMN